MLCKLPMSIGVFSLQLLRPEAIAGSSSTLTWWHGSTFSDVWLAPFCRSSFKLEVTVASRSSTFGICQSLQETPPNKPYSCILGYFHFTAIRFLMNFLLYTTHLFSTDWTWTQVQAMKKTHEKGCVSIWNIMMNIPTSTDSCQARCRSFKASIELQISLETSCFLAEDVEATVLTRLTQWTTAKTINIVLQNTASSNQRTRFFGNKHGTRPVGKYTQHYKEATIETIGKAIGKPAPNPAVSAFLEGQVDMPSLHLPFRTLPRFVSHSMRTTLSQITFEPHKFGCKLLQTRQVW